MYTEREIKQLYAAFSLLCDRVGELEMKVKELEGKKSCKVLKLVPKETAKIV